MRKGYKIWGRWSATKLNLLLFTCPLNFYFEYVLRKKSEVKQSIPKVFGEAIHYMLRRFFQLKYGYKSLEKFINSWLHYWLDYIPNVKYKDRLRMRDPKDTTNYLAIGISILKKFYSENLPYRKGELPKPQVEQSFKLRFKGYRLTGKIDRIQPVENGGVEIWDYKTGYKRPSEEELKRNVQFTFYNLAQLKTSGKNPVKMRLVHLFSGEHFIVPIRTKSDYIQLGRWLDEARIYVQNILAPQAKKWKDFPFYWLNPEDIERKYFSPRPSSFCNICDYEELCRKYKPKDELREYWINQELRAIGPSPQALQLDLFPLKRKRSRKVKSPR